MFIEILTYITICNSRKNITQTRQVPNKILTVTVKQNQKLCILMNQPMVSELRAVLWSQVWSPMPGTRERRGWLPAGACKPVLGRTE